MKYFATGLRLVSLAAVAIGGTSTLSLRAYAADMPTKAPPLGAIATPADVNSSVLWLGGDFKNRVAAGNVGGIYAFSGNLDASGWLVRGQFTYVGYGFDTTLVPSGTAHADFAQANAAIGYQIVGNGLVASGFVGLDYQNYNFNPAAAATPGLRNEAGVIFWGRVATMGGSPFPTAVDGQFSTANDSFWVRGRTGVRFGNFTVGPEVIGLGNNVYSEVRGGGYVSYDLTNKLIIQGDLGYADAIRGQNTSGAPGGSGVYGGMTLVFLH